MKILLIGECNAYHLVKWANAFANKGHEVKIVAMRNHLKNADKLDKKISLEILNIPAPFGYYLNALKLKKIAKEYKADVINVHFASGYATLARLAKLKNALLNIWGSDIYDFPNQGNLNKKTLIKNINYFNKIASTSICMAEEAKKYTDKQIYITPFGVDDKIFFPIAKEKKDKILFGTIKTLAPKYGINYAIEAFAIVKKKLEREKRNDIAEKLEYHIYGIGPDEENLKKQVLELGLEKQIFFKGYVSNSLLNNIINSFDLGIYSSVLDSESFGVALVELMACKVPYVATNVDGFKEVSGNYCTLTPKKDSKAMADELYRYLLDKDNFKCDVENLYKRFLKYYLWEDNVNYMLEIYKQINL